ncbi:MAG: hypothetical protein CME62_11175 [Halobacteriovoraceae bacterium]|nr:hypothetical protein [Halobacteriovoraceae bacterium]
MSSLLFQTQSFLVVGLLIYGVTKRKHKFLHMKIMKTAILWDLLLVAQIELTRSAIEKASKVTSNAMILNIHVSLAISTVLLYFIVYYFGNKLAKGDESVRKYHKPIGILTLTVRIATLITSNLI